MRAVGWLLVPAPLAYVAFMGLQGRYFGRWLMPIFPILCLLGAFFALQLGARAPAARPRRAPCPPRSPSCWWPRCWPRA